MKERKRRTVVGKKKVNRQRKGRRKKIELERKNHGRTERKERKEKLREREREGFNEVTTIKTAQKI